VACRKDMSGSIGTNICGRVRLSILADDSMHKISIRWVEEFGRADAIARREPVVSIMPFLLYCAAVSMAHLTVCGQTLRQAAG